MTISTLIALNALLVLAVVGGLAVVLRLAHRLPEQKVAETFYPSQPITLRLAAESVERALADAA